MAMRRSEHSDDIGEDVGSNPTIVAQLFFCHLPIALF